MSSFKKILVPVDFSGGSRAAVEEAEAIAKAFGGSIDLLHAWELPAFIAPDLLVAGAGEMRATIADYTRRRAGQELESWEDEVKRTGIPVSAWLVMGDAAEAILDRAAAGYDLIVMGTHGRTGVSRFLMGSVAEHVVRRAPCAVLTVRVKETAEASQQAAPPKTPAAAPQDVIQ